VNASSFHWREEANMNARIMGLIAVALLAGPPAATAAVIYEFGGLVSNGHLVPAIFAYRTPEFITADLTVTPGPGFVCPEPPDCAKVEFYPDASPFIDDGQGPDLYDALIFWRALSGDLFLFENGALATLGRHAASEFAHRGVLIVRVSEPATLALLGLGLVVIGLTRPRRAILTLNATGKDRPRARLLLARTRSVVLRHFCCSVSR
jgi:hypothetical protein